MNRIILVLFFMSPLLVACSPHPGSGQWITTGEDKPGYMKEFVRLNVMYEGRTDIFGPQTMGNTDAAAIRRCFWHGVDANAIELSCVQADNTEIEEHYQLRVDADNDTAEMMQGGRTVGRYRRDK